MHCVRGPRMCTACMRCERVYVHARTVCVCAHLCMRMRVCTDVHDCTACAACTVCTACTAWIARVGVRVRGCVHAHARCARDCPLTRPCPQTVLHVSIHTHAPTYPRTDAPTDPRTHGPTLPHSHTPMRTCTHSHASTHPPTPTHAPSHPCMDVCVCVCACWQARRIRLIGAFGHHAEAVKFLHR